MAEEVQWDDWMEESEPTQEELYEILQEEANVLGISERFSE